LEVTTATDNFVEPEVMVVGIPLEKVVLKAE
jgi:hypothetical protein